MTLSAIELELSLNATHIVVDPRLAAARAQFLALLRERRTQVERAGTAHHAVQMTQLAAERGVESTLGRHYDPRQIQMDECLSLACSDSVTGFARWSGGERVAGEDISVRDAVRGTDALVVQATVDKGVIYDPYRHGISPGLLVLAAPDLLREILLQLFMNVVRFLRPLDSMFVRAMAVGERVWIRVSDTGITVSDRDLAGPRPPFLRPRDRYLQDGVGLGFIGIRKAAIAMDGDFLVQRAENNSSTFTLVLPRGSYELEAARRP